MISGLVYVALVKEAKENGESPKLLDVIKQDRARAVKHRWLWSGLGAGAAALGTAAVLKHPIGLPMGALGGGIAGYWLGGLVGDVRQLNRAKENPITTKRLKGYTASPERIRENAIKGRILAGGLGGMLIPAFGIAGRNIAGPSNPKKYVAEYKNNY